MPFLPYREPKVLDSMKSICSVLRENNIRSVLLVTDEFLRTSGATAKLEYSLLESGIQCALYDGTRANPTAKNVYSAKKIYIENKCEALIAFGGGFSMDCAKAVGALIAYPKKELKHLKGLLKIRRKIPTLFAVPTTAGTGSEVTVTAGILGSHIPIMAEHADKEANPLYHVPVFMNEQALKKIYFKVGDWM